MTNWMDLEKQSISRYPQVEVVQSSNAFKLMYRVLMQEQSVALSSDLYYAVDHTLCPIIYAGPSDFTYIPVASGVSPSGDYTDISTWKLGPVSLGWNETTKVWGDRFGLFEVLYGPGPNKLYQGKRLTFSSDNSLIYNPTYTSWYYIGNPTGTVLNSGQQVFARQDDQTFDNYEIWNVYTPTDRFDTFKVTVAKGANNLYQGKKQIFGANDTLIDDPINTGYYYIGSPTDVALTSDQKVLARQDNKTFDGYDIWNVYGAGGGTVAFSGPRPAMITYAFPRYGPPSFHKYAVLYLDTGTYQPTDQTGLTYNSAGLLYTAQSMRDDTLVYRHFKATDVSNSSLPISGDFVMVDTFFYYVNNSSYSIIVTPEPEFHMARIV